MDASLPCVFTAVLECPVHWSDHDLYAGVMLSTVVILVSSYRSTGGQDEREEESLGSQASQLTDVDNAGNAAGECEAKFLMKVCGRV